MRKIFISTLVFCSLFLSSCATTACADVSVSADEEKEFSELVAKRFKAVSISDFADAFNHARYIYPDSNPPWELYDTEQILGFAENMVYLQNPDGGWKKNLDLQRKFSLSELKALQKKNASVPPVGWGKGDSSKSSTIDNGNIFSQIRYLCQVYSQVKDIKSIDSKRYLECATKALQWIFDAQHPQSGGFTGCDVFAITYNDDVMSDTLAVLRDIANAGENSVYSVIPKKMRVEAGERYKKGIECILKTQIELTLSSGEKVLTAWCQQHSHETLKPVWAREFEPPSVCSSESYNVLKLLMQDSSPTEEMKRAIIAGCEFFERNDVKIFDKKIEVTKLEENVILNGRNYSTDKKMIDSPGAKEMWARFYALDSSFDVVTGARKSVQGKYPDVLKPVWCDRGCKYVDSFNDLSQERRNGYSYTNTGGKSLASAYEKWKVKYE